MARKGLGRAGPQVGHPGPPAFLRPVRSVYLPDASSGLNPSASFSPGVVGFSRADWQTSCAILASKATKDQHPDKKSSSDADAVSGGNADENHPLTSTSAAVNGHNPTTSASTTLDLVPMANLPRPLTIADLSPAPMHGSQLRVAYQGIRGAYSEAAADKAYPNCEAIPCDQFEVAFQAVELWIADRAVLPVENSLGGSIHRNYDLLLRHRLNIVD